MSVTVKGKQIDVGEALRGYVNDNLGQAVAKYFTSPFEGQVVFSKDAHKYTADIQLHLGRGLTIQSHGEAGEAYPAFDAGLEKLARQLLRYKKRIADHHRREKAEEAHQAALSYVLEPHDEEKHDTVANDQPIVIAEMQTSIATLTVSEAVMRMDLGDLPALLFRNAANGGLNMVYRRRDGNIGWVDPAGNKA